MIKFAPTETEEYVSYTKAKLKQDKVNRKIATRILKKQDAKRSAEIGPAWYQDLSCKQIKAIEILGLHLWSDIEDGVPKRTSQVLSDIGISPRPSPATLLYAMKRCYMNPIIFLLYLYKIFGTTPLNENAKYFCVNDRLILTAMAHLALPRTLAELCLRLPHIYPPLKKYPVVCPTQFLKTESPYLDLLPFYMNCVRDEEREAIEKRKDYLKKLHALEKELQQPILPYIQQLPSSNSKRYDGRDEIPSENLVNKKETKKPKTKKQAAKMAYKSPETHVVETNIVYKVLCRSDFELLRHKDMRLPEPILTEQTIIALLTGYWRVIYGPFAPPSPSPEEQEMAEKGGVPVMMGLAKGALARMAKRGNPLASLQDSHTLPQVKHLVRCLCSYKLTSKDKDYLLGKSQRNWNVSLTHTPQIPCIPLEFDTSITWGSIYSFKKKNNEHAESYLTRVRQGMVDDAREFWSSMATDYFDIPRFREIHYTYVPSRVQDITFKFKQ